MMHLYDRATMARALTLDLDPELHALLAERIAALSSGEHDLTDWTEFLVVEPGDTEADIVRHLFLSPLVDPIDGIRYPAVGFQPGWNWLNRQHGFFEMIVTFGSTFAYVLLIQDKEGVPSDLLALCRTYAGEAA